MQIDDSEGLARWIVNELTPICDAEPEALAKYVLALLRKPDKSVEQLKEFSHEQLDVFLGAETAKFVEKMFVALETRSYTSNKAKPAEVKIEVKTEPQDAEVSSNAPPLYEHRNEPSVSNVAVKVSPTKSAEVGRRVEEKATPSRAAEQNQRPIRKRISPPPPDEREREREREKEKERSAVRDPRDRKRSRSPRDRRRSGGTKVGGARTASSDRDRYRRRSRSRSDSRSPNQSHRRSERSKRRCKDFEERGFCLRGEQCSFYHGPDPVIMDENALSTMSMVPIPTATPNFSVPPPGFNPMNPPPPGVQVGAGEYNPEAPALTVTSYSIPPPILPVTAPVNQWVQPTPMYNAQPPQYGAQPLQQGGYRGMNHIRGRGSGRGGRGGGIGRGGYHGSLNKDGNTLQVAKIPPELNNIAKLNEHFAAFGTVDNIQVRYNGEPDSALITFASKGEAIRAHKSPAPVLNNRFIKVFWHKPQEAEGSEEGGANRQGGPPMPQALPNEPLIPAEKPKIATVQEAKFVSAEVKNQRKVVVEGNAKINAEKANIAKLVEVQNQQTAFLEKLMEKQKVYLSKARSATDEAAKKTATKLVKVIFKKIKTCKDEIDQITMQISEKSIIIDETQSMIDTLKASTKGREDGGSGDESPKIESRKRKAQDSGDEEVKSKVSSVIVVKGVKESAITDLMAHMEKFGETFGANVRLEDDMYVAVFPYKRSEDASKALANGKTLNGEVLDMELSKQEIDEIPSTDTNMTANQLLAAIPSGNESDDDYP